MTISAFPVISLFLILSCHSNGTTCAATVRNIICVEANDINCKYLFRKFNLSVAMESHEISNLDKMHVVGRGLSKEHFSTIFIKISSVTQK